MESLQSIPAFKIVMLGDSGVGKTSIVRYLHQNVFDPSSDATIGASFVSRHMDTDLGTVTLHIWDTAGQERYRSLVPTYSRGACAGVAVFDSTSAVTFQSLDYWVNTFREAAGRDSMVYVVGNKADLSPALSNEKVESWAAGAKVRVFSVSAKTGIGVHPAFQIIARDIAVSKLKLQQEDGVREMAERVNEEKGGCC